MDVRALDILVIVGASGRGRILLSRLRQPVSYELFQIRRETRVCVEVQLAHQLVVLLVEVVTDEPLESVDVGLWPDEQGGGILFLRFAQRSCLGGCPSEVSENIAGLGPLLDGVRLPVLEQLVHVVEGAARNMFGGRLGIALQLARVLRLHAPGLDVDLREGSREVQVLIRLSILVMLRPPIDHRLGLLGVPLSVDVEERSHSQLLGSNRIILRRYDPGLLGGLDRVLA